MSFRLRSFETLNAPGRAAMVDVFRGVAIVAVVVFHYQKIFPAGYIGVDLFFVISGFLIGGILFDAFHHNRQIHYGDFILRRGGKIWPSYYFFICFGTILAFFLYRDTHSDLIIPIWDMKRYLFFYQNYTGVPFHWSFDHIWSICVEEHFYLVMPLVFIAVIRFCNRNVKVLVTLLCIAVVMGFIAKVLMLEYSHGKDTYSATHNRIDALAYGVILSVIIQSDGERIRSWRIRPYLFTAGLLLVILLVYVDNAGQNIFFHKTVLHSLTPLGFTLMILGAYHTKPGKIFFPLRLMGYYSYNWYLWHPLFAWWIADHIASESAGLVVFMVLTFAVAVLATVAVEEPVLKFRNRWLAQRSKGSIIVKTGHGK